MQNIGRGYELACQIHMFLLCSSTMARFHNLFFALRPPVSVAAEIDRLRQAHRLPGPWLSRERLHVPVLSLGKHPVLPLRLIDHVSELLSEETLPGCHVAFDQLVNGRRSISVNSSRSLHDIERLQARLASCLTSAQVPSEHSRSGPHITLGYNATAKPVRTIKPLKWTASELVLIDSLWGEGKHLTMARWQLDCGNVESVRPFPGRPMQQAQSVQEEQLSLFA